MTQINSDLNYIAYMVQLATTSDSGVFTVIIPIAALAVATQITMTFADEIPHFNVEPVCRGIAQQSGLDLEPNKSVQQLVADCVKGEMESREQLVQQWLNFAPSDRVTCVGESGTGGDASYTNLLTCLQIARDARKLNN